MRYAVLALALLCGTAQAATYEITFTGISNGSDRDYFEEVLLWDGKEAPRLLVGMQGYQFEMFPEWTRKDGRCLIRESCVWSGSGLVEYWDIPYNVRFMGTEFNYDVPEFADDDWFFDGATLWGQFSTRRVVPEPGTLALLGLGLAGLGLTRRRKAN